MKYGFSSEQKNFHLQNQRMKNKSPDKGGGGGGHIYPNIYPK